MHTIFEGVLNLETRLLLLSFVNDHKYFTLEFLNERIANFSFGRTEKRNKPPRSFTNNDLTGSKMHLSGMCECKSPENQFLIVHCVII